MKRIVIEVEETPLEKAKLRLQDALHEVERCEKALRDAQYFHTCAVEVFREREAELKKLEAGVATDARG